MGFYTAILLTAACGQAEVVDDEVRASIQSSIPYIEEQGAWWIDEKKCVSCHRVGTMVWSLNEARRNGFEVSDQLAEWIKWSIDKSLSTNDKGKIVGAGNKEGVAQLIRTIAGLDGFAAEHEQLISLIANNQETDGSWKPDGQLPGQKRPKPETTAVSTMWNAMAVANVEKAQACYDKAIPAIAKSQPGKSTEWYVAKLLLEQQANNTQAVTDLVVTLRSQQREDGGWGWLIGDESDALATGMSLYALREADVPINDPAVTRAIRFLIDSQQPDGSWQVRGTKENKKQRVEETASYWGTTWAALGMLRVIRDAN